MLSDEEYDLEIRIANICLASDRKYGHLVGVFDSLDKVPATHRGSIQQAAGWLAANVNGAPSVEEITEGLERAPGHELWPSLWNGTYQLRRPSEVEPLKRRFDHFNPKKAAYYTEIVLSKIGQLAPQQRASRKAAIQAFGALRAGDPVLNQAMKEGVTEADLNAVFPTEAEWNARCGPAVNVKDLQVVAGIQACVGQASGVTNPPAMKDIMDDLWKLSPQAAVSRKVAAAELVQMHPELGMSADEMEANLSRVFSEDGWLSLWGGLESGDRGRSREIKDDIKLNLMGRGRQVMAW